MNWTQELITASIIGACYVLIFTIAELWRYFGIPTTEKTRKFVHLTSGLVCLSFAYVLKSHLTVLGLSLSFVLILLISKKLKLLQSIHDIERKSHGGIYYPIAIYISFLFSSYYQAPHFYLISILVLAISDSLAALIGSSYGFKLYKVEGKDNRSLEGSLIFFLATFIIVHLGLLLLSDLGRQECVLCALHVAILVTAFESISLGGIDNLFVPIGTSFVLVRITNKPLAEIINQLSILLFNFSLTFLIAYPIRTLGSSGIIGVALLSYAAWSLVTFEWFVPLFLGFILFHYLDLFIEKPKNEKDLFRIRTVFYNLSFSLFWILLANQCYPNTKLFLVPYIINISANLSILWKRKTQLNIDDSFLRSPKPIREANAIYRALFLTLLFLPIHLFMSLQTTPLFSVVTCLFGVILSDQIYWHFDSKYQDKWRTLTLLRTRALIVFLVSAFIFGINVFFHFTIMK